MLNEANQQIQHLVEEDRRQREEKYARRNRMRYIDQLLNELEMLNLADRTTTPERISGAVDRLVSEAHLEQVRGNRSLHSIGEAMDVLYDIQDSLMFNQIEDE